MEINILKDSPFLRKLDAERLKTFYIKILVLDKNEMPLRAIEGRVSAGSISIEGSSSVRRSGSLTFAAEHKDNDLKDVDNLIAMNKKIKILIGIENHIDKTYDRVIWLPLGIFIITAPSITHNNQGVVINIQFKDKMCLLNGECGGNLPTSITFNEYDQMIGLDETDLNNFPKKPNNYTVYHVKGKYYMYNASKGFYECKKDMVGKSLTIQQRVFDIIQTLVCNFGGEAISNIIIEDVPLELRNSVRYTGTGTLYYNSATGAYTQVEDETAASAGSWIPFNYNEDCGYIYTDFTYPGELVSSIGDNVCTILDKIKSTLGNYEYFYDLEGRFIFREKKNYLNSQYNPVQTVEKTVQLTDSKAILTEQNYMVDFSHNSQSVYTFDEGSALINSYSNSPNYENIKNDFHIWGKNQDKLAIHYHLVIKSKPSIDIVALKDVNRSDCFKVIDEVDEKGDLTGKIRLAKPGESGWYLYIPTDWRAYLYLLGLQKKSRQQRPDIYEQELLDLFDSIYDFSYTAADGSKGRFKVDIANHPNDLKYWFDYIEPYGELHDISVDAIGTKIYSYQKDNIKRLYNTDIPNTVMINLGSDAIERISLINKCEAVGQPYSNVAEKIYNSISLGTYGYTAQEVARDLLYQYTDYNAGISISTIPIYYLDVNSRITVNDRASGIYGDYIIRSINVPLDAKSVMSISASKALNRV